MIGSEKPTLDDLSHFGVLGMKWGHRKKATGADIVQARRRIENKKNEIFTAHEKARSSTKRGTPERKAADKKIDDMVTKTNKEILSDRVIAARMTRGEKAVAIIFAGPFAAIPIAATSGVSRHLEKKLDDSKKK